MYIMRRKEVFIPGEYYHIYNRTILGIPEFEDFKSADRLAQSFLLANSTESARAFTYLRSTNNSNIKKAVDIAREGEKLVNVVAYVIMPNHYHLLLKELQEGGVTKFLHKCNTSVAKYINIKKERRGPLFEGKFKAKRVDSNLYLLHLSLYIHLNPLDFMDSKDWRKGNLKNWKLKREKLLSYPWSSLKSFFCEEQGDLILSGVEVIMNQFESRKGYEKYLKGWSVCDFEM